jgi:hypothetical protein
MFFNSSTSAGANNVSFKHFIHTAKKITLRQYVWYHTSTSANCENIEQLLHQSSRYYTLQLEHGMHNPNNNTNGVRYIEQKISTNTLVGCATMPTDNGQQVQ